VGINNLNPTVELDVTGKTKTTTLQVTSGAGNNKILISDASGNASWKSTVAAQTKSITLTPSMFPSEAFSGATRGTLGGFGLPVINMTDGGNREIRISIPIPSDWNGGSMKAKILYSSSTTSGNIYLKVGRSFRTTNESVTAATFSINYAIAVSTTAKGLKQHSATLSGSATGDIMVHIYIRRLGGDALDTNTGIMYFHGVNLEYTTK